MLYWSSDADAGGGDRERIGMSEHKGSTPMSSSTQSDGRVLSSVRTRLSAGQVRAVEEAYTVMFPGQHARNVRHGSVESHLLPLRVAARALDQGADPRAVDAYYACISAQARAMCADAMRQREEPFADVMRAEEDSNHVVNCDQMIAAADPSDANVLTLMRGATKQAAESMSLAEWCARRLGRKSAR